MQQAAIDALITASCTPPLQAERAKAAAANTAAAARDSAAAAAERARQVAAEQVGAAAPLLCPVCLT